MVDHVGAICGGHLAAICPLPDGRALTVGAGGHALSLGPKLEHTLEAVQTTKDILSLATTEDGQAWAGSSQARLLRRSGSSWLRMSGESSVKANVLGIVAAPLWVRAAGDDGSVIEGRLPPEGSRH